MINQPLFSIVTITYNSSQWVSQAIESVIDSAFPDFEYIISDDCSTDETWQIIKTYDDPRIKAFRHQRNITEYPNRNFALGQSTGKYLLFVDGDDYLYGDTLQKLSDYIEAFDKAGSIWGIHEHYFPNEKLPVLLSPEEAIKWIYLANYLFGQIGFSETLFKISLLKKIGGLPVNFVSGDAYIKKLVALEAPVLLVPAGMMYWRTSPGQASAKLHKGYDGFRQNVIIDKDIVVRLSHKNYNLSIDQIKKNVAIRNVKLLLKHSFLKFKIMDGIRLYKELGFKIADFRYLFMKGDYSYRQIVEKEYDI